MKNFNSDVYAVVKNIPKGKVLSYGDVARIIGLPRCARQVGWALHNNPQPGIIPCHRVVFKDGTICSGFAFGGAEAQIALLEGEGVKVENGKVDMNKYGWKI